MRIKPVSSYNKPVYPIRPEINARPEILRLLPKRWQANPTVVAALTACIALANCGRSIAADTPTCVAPVFKHGDGTGSFGCVAVNPPIFLSEDEARKVIVEEAKRAGITFTSDGKTLANIEIPTNAESVPVTGADGKTRFERKHGMQTVSIELDGLSKKRGIAYEFVSGQDLRDWKTGVTEYGTAGSEDVIGTAKALADGITEAKPGGTYGVFYDPAVGWNDARKKAEPLDYSDPQGWQARNAKVKAAANQLAREELRAQVKDFIKWLKAQAVI
jgi:hypothetical protein